MNNETDLGWLVRVTAGVIEPWCEFIARSGTDSWACSRVFDLERDWFTRAQYLARRAELQNKPSWLDAPEWAEWLSQDEDGEWKWLAGLPGKYVDGWTAVIIKGCCKGLVLGDWRDTLERRPVDLSEPAVTALLTKDAENMLAAVPELMDEKFSIDRNDWFERGELPPVGTECEFCGGTGDADDPWHPDLMDGDRVTVIAHFECGICTLAAFTFKSRNPNIATVQVEQANYGCFRPIRTERDVLIDVLAKAGVVAYGNLIADAILAAGFSLGAK